MKWIDKQKKKKKKKLKKRLLFMTDFAYTCTLVFYTNASLYFGQNIIASQGQAKIGLSS